MSGRAEIETRFPDALEMDPLVEAFQTEGYEVDVFPGPVMKHAVAVPDPFILQISLHVAETAAVAAGAWAARAARRWWRHHHSDTPIDPQMKLARIFGPRGEVLRIVEIPGNNIDSRRDGGQTDL